MTDNLPPIIDDGEHYILPQEWFQFLPPEMREELKNSQEHISAILKSVEREINQLRIIANALPTMVSLRYIQYRLANTPFDLTTESMLETDMLTSAFAVTYKRLIDGGTGMGVSRKQLPAHLRPVHNDLITLRNQRYAHNSGHSSISNDIEMMFNDGKFEVKLNHQMGMHVQGAIPWQELVIFLDGLMHERLQKQLAILSKKTGYEWVIPGGAIPPWAEDAEPSPAPEDLKE
jgi:hypothetical protein